jgi:hypothetical protein
VGTLKSVPSLAVIEGFEVPLRQHEILAVVFRMAVHALQTRTRFDVVGGVQSFSRDDARSNFVVTAQALEYGFAGRDLVAGNTVGHAIDRLVCAGERAWRDLCYCRV